ILVGTLGDTYVIDWGLVSVENGKEYKLNIPKIVVERIQLAIDDNLLDDTEDAITAHLEQFLGTPGYMAPEQILKDDHLMGPVSDIWALGVVLFEALTGSHPVIASGITDPRVICQSTLDDEIQPPIEITKAVPPELSDLCVRMLHKDPLRRVQSL